jgi:peptidoglycan hydrolase CwlO-like protein
MQRTHAQRLVALPLALLLSIGSIAAVSPHAAYAEGEGPDITPNPPTAMQMRIEASAAAYNDAIARADELQRLIDENNERVAQVQQDLPAQQERAEAALISMYKLSESRPTITDVLMGTQSFGDFLTAMDYLTGIAEGQAGELAKLRSLQSELARAESQLQAEKAEADDVKARAEQALMEAQTARQAAVAAAAAQVSQEEVEAARQQVVQQAVEQAQQQAQEAVAAGASQEEAAAKVEEARAQAEQVAVQVDATTVASGGVNWDMGRDEFVKEWSGRIDSYLEGSPLAGQGETFASSAWDYGVDPRWSPAIANVESTKGEYCFADHNAWGWGSVNWDSWEEAIDGHVKGLADGYGSTISEEGAEKYCPPNADFWYNETLGQMNQI